jgi:endoglucanase
MVLACLVFAASPATAADVGWPGFRDTFVSAEGRVVDSGQGGISHSEGQGIAMLLAVGHRDRATFERLWSWTRKELQIRNDALLAWRWEPGRGVTDRNNASDGDLLVAWALAEAATLWRHPPYRDEAARLAVAIRQGLLRPSAFGPVLLPGIDGFERTDETIVNLSYWVFTALRAMRDVDDAPEWAALEQSGLALLAAARFGRWQLPPDWLSIRGDKVVPAGTSPPRFGYDSIRIPLYLRWAGLATPQRMAPYLNYWTHFDGAHFLPAWTLLTDDSVDSHGASAGMLAVVAYARNLPPPVAPGNDNDYYSLALRQLVALARRGTLEKLRTGPP